ncbi:kinesin-like protein KIF3B [Lycorma delicatula]|uniref:kinesin-like protein KIF3B n=1 Tax=Lycorma delicatula TaxID=130591 RepID=UPI003F5138AF
MEKLQKNRNRSNNNQNTTGGSGHDSVKVVVRCRPMNRREVTEGYKNVAKVLPAMGSIYIFNPKENDTVGKQFTFDAVYDWNSSQEELYEESVQPLVSSVLDGFNATVFAYGQTGTGKTYTMEGSKTCANNKGIIPKSFEQIFNHISCSKNMQYLVRASYLEIYQEEIRDLLDRSKKQYELRQNESGVYVKNLQSYVCKSAKEIERVMLVGNQNRTVGATDMNIHSSRSHAIFIITIEMSEIISGIRNQVRVGKLNLVDLAGSERQSKSKANPERLKEASKINLSLSALGNVISALENGNSTHIPYRDSKLTRLLSDSLGGNSKTLMIANIGPASYNYDESLTTLRYANRAKNIKNKPRINEDPKDALLREYQEEIKRLKALLAERANNSQLTKKKKRRKSKVLQEDSEGELEPYKTHEEILHEEEEKLTKAIAKMSSEKLLSDDEKKKMKEMEEKRAKLAAEKLFAEEIRQRIKSMESKLLSGGKNILDRTNEQQKMLELQAAEIRERKRREIEIRQLLELQEETAEEMRETYLNKQHEVEVKTKKLKKLLQKYHAVKKETSDIIEEYNRDRRELEMTQNELMKALKLNMIILENFIPKEEMKKAMARLYYDEEEDVWRTMPESEPTEVTGRLVSDPSLRRPETDYSRTAARMGLNSRYRGENIICTELEKLGRTTRKYEGPTVSPSIRSVMEAALQVEDDIDVDAAPITKRHYPRYRIPWRSNNTHNVSKPLQPPVYPKTRGLVPK